MNGDRNLAVFCDFENIALGARDAKHASFDVRSPAPPVVALIGLLGMLIGEQVVPAAKRLMTGQPISAAWVKSECVPHIFGELPTKPAAETRAKHAEDQVHT
jgi:XapX domain-containing protein